MKKLLILYLVLFLSILNGCYKSDSLDFMQGQYIMKQSESTQINIDGFTLEEASIILFEISIRVCLACTTMLKFPSSVRAHY